MRFDFDETVMRRGRDEPAYVETPMAGGGLSLCLFEPEAWAVLGDLQELFGGVLPASCGGDGDPAGETGAGASIAGERGRVVVEIRAGGGVLASLAPDDASAYLGSLAEVLGVEVDPGVGDELVVDDAQADTLAGTGS